MVLRSRSRRCNTSIVLRRGLFCSVLIAIGAVLAASTATGAPSATPGLRIAYSVAPTSLDPQASNVNQTWLSWSLSYECLLRATPGGDVVPSLAESYTVSPDRLTYDFTLRKGVKFHDNRDFTSASVLFTFKRLLATGIPYAKGLFPTLTNVEALGKYKVRFTLSKPQAGFLLNMGNPYAVACGIMTSNASATQMVGTGPWRQTSYTPNQSLELKRFEHYWGTKTVAPSLSVLYIPEQSAMLAALKAGNVDIAYPDPGILPAIKGDKKFKLKYVPSARNYRLQLNNEGAMADIRVRQAILLAVDAKAIGRQAFLGYGFESGTIPFTYPWAPRVKQYQVAHKRNVAGAKQLLKDAGYPNGIKLRFAWPTPNDPVYDRGAQILQSQLAEAGIRLDMQPYDFATWLNRHLAHNYDITGFIHSWFADPLEYVRPRTGQYGGPTPPTVQALWDAAVAAPTLKAYYAALAQLALEEDKVAFNLVGLANQTVIVASKSNLKNVNPDFTLTWLYLAGVSQV